MTALFTPLLYLHLICAFLATVLFWIAGSAMKGGPLHRRVGGWFSRFVYATAATGAVMAITRLAWRAADQALTPAEAGERQTMWLVLYVLLTIVAPVQHGIAVVAAGAVPGRVRSRLHATLAIGSMIGSMAILPAALIWGQWLFLIVAPIGFIVGLRNMAWANRPAARRDEWEREHLTSLLTAGATLHTALLVFSSSRSLGLHLPGVFALVPWTLPAVIGMIAILWLRTTWKAASPGPRKVL